MTKKELDKTGIKILEHDVSDGSIYLGTNTLYIYNDRIYFHEHNSNINRYTGKENIITDLGDRNTFFKTKHDYLMLNDLTEEGENTLTDWEKQSFKDCENM